MANNNRLPDDYEGITIEQKWTWTINNWAKIAGFYEYGYLFDDAPEGIRLAYEQLKKESEKQ